MRMTAREAQLLDRIIEKERPHIDTARRKIYLYVRINGRVEVRSLFEGRINRRTWR
jgi:hypothetical protein